MQALMREQEELGDQERERVGFREKAAYVRANPTCGVCESVVQVCDV